MLEMLQTTLPSVIDKDMIWVAEYNDNTFLFERDFQTNDKHSFYTIEKNKIKKFGLIGLNYNCHFDVFGGIFNINGRTINIRLLTKDHVHFLTEQNLLYNDIITYIDASARFDSSASVNTENENEVMEAKSEIDAFNIGYKSYFNSYGINFYFQVIATFPYAQSAFLNIKISTDSDLYGKLVIMVNDSTSLDTEIKLTKNIGGELNWQMAL